MSEIACLDPLANSIAGSAATMELQRARAYTARYHNQYYKNHTLYEKGSWLENPSPFVLALAETMRKQKGLKILDLGAGVGRNALALAEKLAPDAELICVDNLPLALSLLQENAAALKIENKIELINEDYEKLQWQSQSFDLIMAISCLEHCSSYENLLHLLLRLQTATKAGGRHLLAFSTNRKVQELETEKAIDTPVETKLDRHRLESDLRTLYSGWHIEMWQLEGYKEILNLENNKLLWQSEELSVQLRKP